MRKLILGVFFTAALAFPADFFSFGVKGGVPFNDAFKSVTAGNIKYITNTKHYTVGPTVEIGLPFGLGIEVDALYRRLDFESTSNAVDVFVRRATTANAWDFPLLAKWKAGEGVIRPFLTVGPTFRNLSSIQQVENFFTVPTQRQTTTSTSSPAELRRKFTTGFTVGGGIQFGSGFLKLSPEIRYTRWGWDSFRDVSGAFKSNPDQVEFLMGLTF